jgi:AcrR family transcriptional regulator
MARSNDPAATRQAIVEGAHGLMARFGSRRVTIEDVAREVGLSRQTVYAYFADRQALVDQVLLWNGHLIRLELERRLDGVPGFADKVAAAAAFGAEPGLLRMGELQPETLALLLTTGGEPWLRRATDFWEPVVRAAQANGEVRPELAPRPTAAWVARSLFALAVMRPDPQGADHPTSTELLVRTYLAGGLA